MAEENKKERDFSWKDFVAMTIALLTTTLLPLLVIIAILIAVVLIVSLHIL